MSNTNSPTALEGTPEHGCDRKWESPADGEFQSAFYNGKCFFTEHLDNGVRDASRETVKLYDDDYFCAMHAKKPSASEWEDRGTQQEKIIQALYNYYEEPNKAIEKNILPGDLFEKYDSGESIIVFNECHVVTFIQVHAYAAKILIDRSDFCKGVLIASGPMIQINESTLQGTSHFISAVNSQLPLIKLRCSNTEFDYVRFDNVRNLQFDQVFFNDGCVFAKYHKYIFSNDYYSFTSCYLKNVTFEKCFPQFIGVDLPLHHNLPTTIDAYPFMKQRVKCWRNIGKLVKALGPFIINLLKALKPSKGLKDRVKSACIKFTDSIIEEDTNNKTAAHDLFLMTRQLKESNTAGFYMYLEECCKGCKGNKLAKAYNVFFGSGYLLVRPLVWYVLMIILAAWLLGTSASNIPLSSYLLHGLWPLGIINQFKAVWWKEALLFIFSLLQLLSMFIFTLAIRWRGRKQG
jgi:hypothetical protein